MDRNSLRQSRSKYGNKKVQIDGITFDSIREGRRYGELKLLLHAGQIQTLELQPKFELHAYGSELIGVYKADFAYFEGDKRVIEDAKGFRTPLYRWKKKHTEAEYKVQIREV